MRRTRVVDRWGERWTVRARYERNAAVETDYSRRLREPVLRGRLAAMLAPEAAPSPEGSPADGHHDLPTCVPIGICEGLRYLTQPRSRFWIVELYACGRFRRGATWRVAGREEAAHGVAAVAQAVHTGAPVELADALLIDVVDQRLTVYGAAR